MHGSLGTVEDLFSRFTSYEYSYSKLLLELGRRRQYKEAAEKVVQGMLTQLEAMVDGKAHSSLYVCYALWLTFCVLRGERTTRTVQRGIRRSSALRRLSFHTEPAYAVGGCTMES